MNETGIFATEGRARFNEILWHDSKLLALEISKDPAGEYYNLELTIDLIVSPSKGVFERSIRKLLFKECPILKLDFDLLGMFMCGGDIADATFYDDAVDLERKIRNNIKEFDLPQNSNPLDECFGFQIEMIHPGWRALCFCKGF